MVHFDHGEEGGVLLFSSTLGFPTLMQLILTMTQGPA
jgi:hypothetical protein